VRDRGGDSWALRGSSHTAVLRISTTLPAAGTALTLLGVLTDSVAAAIAGTLAAGIGYGAAALAALGSVARLAGPADPAQRSQLFAVAYTVAYLSFSVPALAAGRAAALAGLRATVVVYSLVVVIIGLAAFSVHEFRLVRVKARRPFPPISP
jgi:hypothetical protein